MNTRHLSLFTLAFALSSALAGPAPNDAPAIGYVASKITVPTWNSLRSRMENQQITVGTARTNVEERLGQPKQTLSPEVWLYDNCQPDDRKPSQHGCNLLVITFDQGKVTEMKFVNQPAAKVIAAQIELTRSGSLAVNK